MLIHLSPERALSWIWNSSPLAGVMILSETLWNVFACNWSNRWVTMVFSVHTTDNGRPANRWSMVQIEIVWWKVYTSCVSRRDRINPLVVYLCRHREMIHTSVSFDSIVLFEAAVGWLHQSLRWNLSIIDISTALHLCPQLVDVMVVLVCLGKVSPNLWCIIVGYHSLDEVLHFTSIDWILFLAR